MPKPQLLDLMRMACEPQLVHDYNQFLSKGAEEAFWKDVLWWLEICVLEDKMHRLLELSGDDAADPEKLVQVFASQGQGGWTAHGGSYRDVHQVLPGDSFCLFVSPVQYGMCPTALQAKASGTQPLVSTLLFALKSGCRSDEELRTHSPSGREG